MTGRRRPAGPVTLAIAAATVLAGCTGTDGDPGPDPARAPTATSIPSRAVPATDTTSPSATLTLVAETSDVEASLHISRELFAAAPVVVLAATGQPAAQELAARAAVELGVP